MPSKIPVQQQPQRWPPSKKKWTPAAAPVCQQQSQLAGSVTPASVQQRHMSPQKDPALCKAPHIPNCAQTAKRAASCAGQGARRGTQLPKPSAAAAFSKASAEVSAAGMRSPLKGHNAWPPPSPSPKKGKPGRSQNRAPAGGHDSVHRVMQQPPAYPPPFYDRLR